MLMGPAGLGKSSVVAQIAKARNMKVIDLRLSELEPGDLVGMPYIDKLENGKSVTRYGAPEWWHSLSEGPTILFLDEVDRAREDMQPLAMQLCLDRRAGGRPLPTDTIVFAAGNGLKYQTASMDQALVNRFAMIEFSPTVAEWCAWATAENGVHPAVLQFISDHPSALDTPEKLIGVPNEVVPTRRSWAFLGEVLLQDSKVAANIRSYAANLKLMIWAAPFIGDDLALMFNNWVSSSYKRVLSVSEIFENNVVGLEDFTLPQVVDSIGVVMEVFVKDEISDLQRINAMKFYNNFSHEAATAFIERLPETYSHLIRNPEVAELVTNITTSRSRFDKLTREQDGKKASKKKMKA